MARHVLLSEDKHGFWEARIKDGKETTATEVFHSGDGSAANLDQAMEWSLSTMHPDYERADQEGSHRPD